MVQQSNLAKLELGGSAQQQKIASEVWNLMRLRGLSFASSSPITLTLDSLAEYFAEQKYQGYTKPEELKPLVDKALSASPQVFLREETLVEQAQAEDAPPTPAKLVVTFKTTKTGRVPVQVVIDQHSFKERLFLGAEPVDNTVNTETEVRFPEHHLPLPKPAEPELPAPPIERQPSVVERAKPAVERQPSPNERAKPAIEKQSTSVEPVASPTVNHEKPVTLPKAKPVQTPVAPTPTAPVVPSGPLLIEVADGVTVDLSQPTPNLLSQYGDYFASAVQHALEDDFRAISFANDWYLEDITGRYNKNDLRRVRDYMTQDIEGPATDAAILTDVWGKRNTDQDYEATRFALNYRLFKEKKDFEFVGVADDRVWSAPGVPQIGSPRHKATEIGTDYKFLEDPTLADPSELVTENGARVWRHILTFYEYENGVLPYDATAKELFPQALMEEQKSLILRFEAPQIYEAYTAELRYPSGNRGGWIGGLEQFYVQNLVPGSILVIRQSKKSNHFTIEYEQSEEQNANVLLYDDRRQKFVFRPIVFACQVQADSMLTSERYGKLNGQKRLEESDRKKTDAVIVASFEYAAPKTTQGYYALLDDIYPVANIERPFSRNYLRHLLTHGNAQFQADETTPDAFTYKPPVSGVRR